jgi:hypothetical protein
MEPYLHSLISVHGVLRTGDLYILPHKPAIKWHLIITEEHRLYQLQSKCYPPLSSQREILMKITVFWGVTLCNIYCCFGGSICLLLQGTL